MNIYDISKEAGVSIATVSRVLNESPHVSAATRARVLAVIEKSGYVPNAFARGLGLNTMRTIGLLCPDAADPYLALALSLLERDFRLCGYHCVLVCTGRELPEREAGIRQLLASHVDAMVLMGSTFVEEADVDNACIREAAAVAPVAILNGLLEAENVYSVLCDDAEITARAVTALMQAGHRRILYLGIGQNQSARNKLRGYREGLRQSGLPASEERVLLLPPGRPQIEELIEALRGTWQENPFDAVMCAEDLLAVAAIKMLGQERLRVPEDVAVIGYNNSIFASVCEPELTSVDNRLPAICEAIVDTLVKVLEGEEVPRKTVFPGELVFRQSAVKES